MWSVHVRVNVCLCVWVWVWLWVCVCVWSESYRTGGRSGNVNNKGSAKQALIKANRLRTEPLQKHVSPSDPAEKAEVADCCDMEPIRQCQPTHMDTQTHTHTHPNTYTQTHTQPQTQSANKTVLENTRVNRELFLYACEKVFFIMYGTHRTDWHSTP